MANSVFYDKSESKNLVNYMKFVHGLEIIIELKFDTLFLVMLQICIHDTKILKSNESTLFSIGNKRTSITD